MKMRTVRRGIVILCIMCILAACARESAAAEGADSAADTAAASAEPAWFENSIECLRLISDCLGQNKSPLPPDETLPPDGGTFSAG